MRKFYSKLSLKFYLIVLLGIISLPLSIFRLYNFSVMNSEYNIYNLSLFLIMFSFSFFIIVYSICKFNNDGIFMIIENNSLYFPNNEKGISFENIDNIKLEKDKIIIIQKETEEFIIIEQREILKNITDLCLELKIRLRATK